MKLYGSGIKTLQRPRESLHSVSCLCCLLHPQTVSLLFLLTFAGLLYPGTVHQQSRVFAGAEPTCLLRSTKRSCSCCRLLWNMLTTVCQPMHVCSTSENPGCNGVQSAAERAGLPAEEVQAVLTDSDAQLAEVTQELQLARTQAISGV